VNSDTYLVMSKILMQVMYNLHKQSIKGAEAVGSVYNLTQHLILFILIFILVPVMKLKLFVVFLSFHLIWV
jgi:hypothetical protein